METSDLAVSDGEGVKGGGDLFQEAYLYLTEHRYPPGCENSRSEVYGRRLESSLCAMELCSRKRGRYEVKDEAAPQEMSRAGKHHNVSSEANETGNKGQNH